MAKKQKLDNRLLTSLLYIAVGVLFCIFRAGTLNWMLTIVGILFLVDGVLGILRHDTVSGVIGLVLGLLLILGGWLFVEIILVIFGILILVKGVTALSELLRHNPDPLSILMAGGTVLIGILLIVSRWAMLDWFFIILGILFVIDGALVLIGKK